MRKHLPADDYMFLRRLSLLVFAGSETRVLLKPLRTRGKKQTSECFTRVKKMHRERGGREQMPVCEAQSHTLQQRFKAVTSRGDFVRIITPPHLPLTRPPVCPPVPHRGAQTRFLERRWFPLMSQRVDEKLLLRTLNPDPHVNILSA